MEIKYFGGLDSVDDVSEGDKFKVEKLIEGTGLPYDIIPNTILEVEKVIDMGFITYIKGDEWFISETDFDRLERVNNED